MRATLRRDGVLELRSVGPPEPRTIGATAGRGTSTESILSRAPSVVEGLRQARMPLLRIPSHPGPSHTTRYRSDGSVAKVGLVFIASEWRVASWSNAPKRAPAPNDRTLASGYSPPGGCRNRTTLAGVPTATPEAGIG